MLDRVVTPVRDTNQSTVVKKSHRESLLQCRFLQQYLRTGAKLCELAQIRGKYTAY